MTFSQRRISFVNFNADGYLDAGIHDLKHDDIEEQFVSSFPTSTTRKPIFSGYCKHREEIAALYLDCLQLLDGSFVTSKNDPGDIDLVGLIDMDSVDALSGDDKQRLAKLFAGPGSKANYMCDAYFLPQVPETDPRYPKLRQQRKYWMGEFGFDRADKPKGMIRVNVDANPKQVPASTAASAT